MEGAAETCVPTDRCQAIGSHLGRLALEHFHISRVSVECLGLNEKVSLAKLCCVLRGGRVPAFECGTGAWSASSPGG